MNFADYLIVFSAMVVMLAAIRYTYLQWRNIESQETITLRKMLLRYAGERERLESDRDKWMRESADRYLELDDLKKKLAHYRKQLSPAKLAEIDDSYPGENDL